MTTPNANSEARRDGLTYEEWMKAANRECWKIARVSLDDLGDFNSWDDWNSGMTPREGALDALEQSDFPMDELES